MAFKIKDQKSKPNTNTIDDKKQNNSATDELLFPSNDFFDDEVNSLRIHIRMQKRRGKKCLTLIEGLPNDLDLKKIVKIGKQLFKTAGTIKLNNNGDKIIMFQGDFRNEVKQFLIEYNIAEKSQITVHGF